MGGKFWKTRIWDFFFKPASNELKIGTDPFHYAPNRLRVSKKPETGSILIKKKIKTRISSIWAIRGADEIGMWKSSWIFKIHVDLCIPYETQWNLLLFWCRNSESSSPFCKNLRAKTWKWENPAGFSKIHVDMILDDLKMLSSKSGG